MNDRKYVASRLNYFENQLLRVVDFEAEQRHHVERLRDASRAHLSPGRVEGLALDVSGTQADPVVKIDRGLAVDADGRWIVAPAPLSAEGAGTYVGILWREAPGDEVTDSESSGNTRIHDAPRARLYDTPAALAADGAVHLGTLQWTDSGWTVDPAPPAGLALRGPGGDDIAALLRVEAQGLVIRGRPPGAPLVAIDVAANGKLTVAGPLSVVGLVTVNDIAVKGSLTVDKHLAVAAPVTAQNGLTVRGAGLTVEGPTKLDTLSVSYMLEAKGGLQLPGSLHVPGNLTTGGALKPGGGLTTDNLVYAKGGVVAGGYITIGTAQHGFIEGAIESIQQAGHLNLRVYFGTTERFRVLNSGTVQILLDLGFWEFTTDGRIARRQTKRLNGTPLDNPRTLYAFSTPWEPV